MFNQMHQTPVIPQMVPSKRSYKKLGTILEHISVCIHPHYYRYAVQIFSHFPLIVNISIETIPTPNIPQPVMMCVITWTDGTNGQLYINPTVLHENAEW